MAEENNNNTNSNSNPADNTVGGSGVQPGKKPKTQRQIERERERRKRRRQKKAQLGKSEVVKSKAGQDVPLILPSKEGEKANEQAPSDVSLDQELHPEKPEKSLDEQVLEHLETEENPANTSAEPTPAMQEPAESQAESEQEDNTAQTGQTEEAAVTEEAFQPEPADLEQKVQLPEQSAQEQEEPQTEPATQEETYTDADRHPPVPPQPWSDISYTDHDEEEHYQPEPEATPEPEYQPEQPIVTEPVDEPHEEVHPQHEDHLEEENLRKARELSESLLGNQDTLDELPPKPGILGRLFDWLQTEVSKRRKEKPVQAETQISEAQPPQPPKPPFKFNLTWLWPFFKLILTLAILAGLVIGAYWLGSSLKLYDRVASWFAPKPGQEQLAVGNNSKVIIDPAMLRKFGFETALLISKNAGNKDDLTYNVFFNANYFGKLKELVFFGETGISAALYYGFGKDAEYISNRFIYYVKFLDKLQNAYTVNIYDVMDGKVDREAALKKYLTDTNALFNQGNNLRKEINVQVDDLTVSLNTINPDKDRYETDFFASLAALEAEKSDMLIKKFIDTTQKQVEVKAKLAAMSKLSQYYEKVLLSLKLRLDAVDKNQAALINGIQVTDIPGANLDLVKTQ